MKGVNPAAVLAIWRRQLGSLLLNPLGYIFIGVFVVVTVGILLIPESFFYRNIADLGPLYAYMPWLLVVLLPALGMGAWASERELGTEEQLLTLPLTVSDALLGKWLGVTAYWTLALACSLSVVGVLAWLGEPDYGLIFSNYVGWWCAGLLFGAASVLASSLVGLPAIAFVLGVLLSASLMALAHALDWFDPFNRGLIPLGRLVQTAVAIYFLLGAAMVSVNARRWSTATVPFLGVVMTLLLFGYCAVCVILVLRETYRGPLLAPIGFVLLAAWGLAMVPRHLLLHAAAFVGLGVTLVNFGVQSDRAAVDWDTTGERLSSLSGASLDVLKQLKRPVKITAFISKDLPPKLALKGKEVENTLKVLDREMGEEVTLDLYRPENALDEAGSKATQFHGIMPRNEIQETVTGKDNVDVFLGAVVSCGARTQKIEYFDPGLSVEYELVRAIRTVSQEKKKVVGVVETDLKLMGGFDMQARQSLPEWEIVQEWKRQYDVRDVKLDAKVGDDVDVLVVPQPSRLGDLELRNLHDYVWDGRPALILEDPCPVFTSPTLGTSQPKRPPNPMMGMPPEDGEKGDLKPLLRALGIDVEADMVGWSDYLPSHEFRKILPPNFVCTDAPKGGIHEAAATRGIASLLLPFPGFIKEDAGKPKELTVTPLVTPIPSINWGKHGFNEHFENNPFFGMRRKEVKRWTPGSGEAPALAVEITGKLRRAYPRDEAPPAEEGKTGEKEDGAPGVGELGAKSAHVIYIADLDLASDQFFAFYRNSGERISEDVLKWLLDLRNVQFLANAVDALADDQAFLELRTRRPQRRPLAKIEGVIEATQKICREVEDAAQKEYEDEKERIEKEFEKELQAIDDRKDLDEHAKKQLKEQRRLSGRRDLDRQIEQLQRDAELKLRKAEIEQNRQVGGAQFWVKLWAILIPAAALSLVGGLVFLRRILGERTIVPESRRRS